jgi:hypothetical protein
VSDPEWHCGTAATTNTPQIDELRRRLRELATRVDLDDAQSLVDTRKPALREILLWEFGSDFRKDAKGPQTVEQPADPVELIQGDAEEEAPAGLTPRRLGGVRC